MATKKFLLWFFILLKFGLQYALINPIYDLHRDEYLHLDQAKHLAWGYVSVPPVTSWISLLILLLGNSVFWVKFFPALFGALTLVVVWKIIELLKGNVFALILGATAVTFSVVMRINILYQPNSLDILCWTLLYYCFLQYICTENNKWLWAASLTLALGFLNKYNILFLLLGLLPAILLTGHRKIFLNKHLYFSLFAAFLLVLPNLYWQYQHNFPVITHLSELSSTQLVNVNRIDFLKEQLLFFSGSLFVIIGAFVSFFRYPPFRKYQVFFWAYVCTMLIFVYFKAKGYYAIGLYPILLSFGAVYLERFLTSGWKVYLRPVVIGVIILAFIPLIQVVFPVLSPAEIQKKAQMYKDLNLLRWEDGKDHPLPQDFADMLGWRELARKVDSAYSSIPAGEHTLVLCDNYGQAGAINYYTQHKHLQAVSFNADYINWFPLENEIRNIILVQEADDNDISHERERAIFQSVSLNGQIVNPFAREQGTSIYVLRGAKTSVNDILKEEIAGRINKKK